MRYRVEIVEDLNRAMVDLEAAEKEVYFQEMARDDCKVYVEEFKSELAEFDRRILAQRKRHR